MKGDSGGSATQLRAAGAGDTLCIDRRLNALQVVAWLMANGFDVQEEPLSKLWSEPPMTGPRAGVDTTRYVDFFRVMASRTVVSYNPDSAGVPIPFDSWPADSQTAFVLREWRCGLFNLCGPDTCVCGSARWVFEDREG